MTRKSFSIHSDFYSELCNLTSEQRGDILLALVNSAMDIELPELDPVCAMLFRLMKAQSERISSANSANGSKGGRKKTSEESEQSEVSEVSEESEISEGKRIKPSVSVTVSNTDTEKEIPPTPLGESGPDAAAMVRERGFSAPVESKVMEWLRYKKERKEGYKPTGLKSLLTEIGNNVARYGESAVIWVVGTSMANGWKGIIWDKLQGGSANGPPGARINGITDAEKKAIITKYTDKEGQRDDTAIYRAIQALRRERGEIS